MHTHLDSGLAWSLNIRPDELKASAPSEYKAAINLRIIQWPEHIYAKDTHKLKKVRFPEFINANPLVFDLHKDNNLQESPFGSLLNMLNNEWKDVCKYMGDKTDITEEEDMVKIFDKPMSKITDVRTILGPSFGLGFKSSSLSSSYPDKQDKNKKRKFDYQEGLTSQYNNNNSNQQKQGPQSLGTCQGCGYERKS